jgi:flagellar basal-body rod protein FlgF
MDKLFYIAASGAKQNMMAQAAHANNLANAGTTGFKADFNQHRSMPVYGDGMPTRAFAMAERPGTDFKYGSLVTTGRDLDVAVKGDGWIVVQDAQGNPAYSRSGSFHISPDGLLVNSEGLLVMGDGESPIAIPPSEKVQIGTDGTITVKPLGSTPTELEVVDRLWLAKPDQANLTKGPDGLFRNLDGAVDEPRADVAVVSGAIEGSNVNAVEELIGMITHSRQFEMQVKMIKTAEEMDTASARLLQS